MSVVRRLQAIFAGSGEIGTVRQNTDCAEDTEEHGYTSEKQNPRPGSLYVCEKSWTRVLFFTGYRCSSAPPVQPAFLPYPFLSLLLDSTNQIMLL